MDRNTPIGFANRILTKTIPNILINVDNVATGGRLGRFLGYFFSERTPLVMVCLVSVPPSDFVADYIPFPHDRWNSDILFHNMEKHPWSRDALDPCVCPIFCVPY